MGPGSTARPSAATQVYCTGALAVLDAMDEISLNVNGKRAVQLRAGLVKLPTCGEVSGLGLMVGIAFDEGIKAAMSALCLRKREGPVGADKARLRLFTAADSRDARRCGHGAGNPAQGAGELRV